VLGLNSKGSSSGALSARCRRGDESSKDVLLVLLATTRGVEVAVEISDGANERREGPRAPRADTFGVEAHEECWDDRLAGPRLRCLCAERSTTIGTVAIVAAVLTLVLAMPK